MLAVALNVKAEKVCVGTYPCTGQMLCKFSFVLSVDVLQHDAFLFFCLSTVQETHLQNETESFGLL